MGGAGTAMTTGEGTARMRPPPAEAAQGLTGPHCRPSGAFLHFQNKTVQGEGPDDCSLRLAADPVGAASSGEQMGQGL